MSTADAEYQTALTGSGLWDTSSAAKLEISGPDAPMFLGNLSTNDIKNVPLGGGCETYFCDPRAKVQFQAWAYHVRPAGGDHAIWVETTPGRNAELAKYLDRYLISERVEIADRTADYAQMHVAGPTASAVLSRAFGGPIPPVEEFQHLERSTGDVVCSVRRRDPLGLPGFDVVCRAERAADVRIALTAAGASPAGADSYETLRVEAGSPVWGVDIDANRFVMEVGHAARAVSYTKGCFLGQEPIVMARDRAGHVNRVFSGLKLLAGGTPQSGSKVYRDGQEVGGVTSSIMSPRLELPVALAYLRWKHQDVGTALEVDGPHGRQPAEVIGLPIR